jgi:hypothetical protein
MREAPRSAELILGDDFQAAEQRLLPAQRRLTGCRARPQLECCGDCLVPRAIAPASEPRWVRAVDCPDRARGRLWLSGVSCLGRPPPMPRDISTLRSLCLVLASACLTTSRASAGSSWTEARQLWKQGVSSRTLSRRAPRGHRHHPVPQRRIATKKTGAPRGAPAF